MQLEHRFGTATMGTQGNIQSIRMIAILVIRDSFSAYVRNFGQRRPVHAIE